MTECPGPVDIAGTTPADVLHGLAVNMERFGACRVRHRGLIDAVRARQ